MFIFEDIINNRKDLYEQRKQLRARYQV